MGFFLSTKPKITYSCESGDERIITNYIDFYSVKEAASIRYEILKEMIRENNVAVQINTNFNCIDPNLDHDKVIMNMMDELKSRGYTYDVLRIHKEQKGIFGGLLKNKGDKQKAYKLFFILPAGQFNPEISKLFFEYYDVELGIGFELSTVENLMEKFKMDFLEMQEFENLFQAHIFSALNFHRVRIEVKREEQPRIKKLVKDLNDSLAKK